MSLLEITAVIFGVLYVLLAVITNPWCWPAGIISSALYIVFDLQGEVKYFQDAILQTFYVLAGVYGWYMWTRKTSDTASKIQINSWSLKQMAPWFLLGLLVFPITGYIFSRLGNAYSYLDAFTTVFSFIATYFTAKKILENWWMWVFLNLIFIGQWVLKGAYLTAGLYLFLALMAVFGYYEWRKQLQKVNADTT